MTQRRKPPPSFTAYHDASGTESGGGMLCVAGVVSTERKWRRFEEDWNRELARFGVSAFHMRRFAHSRGEYRKWAGKYDLRAEFLRSLIGVTKRGIHKAFATIIPADVFEALSNVFDFGTTSNSGAYHVAAVWNMGQAERWISEKHRGRTVYHCLEKGDKGQGALAAGERPFFQNMVTILPKRDPASGAYIRQFEAADLIAREYRKYVFDVATAEDRSLRLSLGEIERSIPVKAEYLPLEWAADICASIFPRRSDGS
jgi:hypothetical protein